MGNYGDISKGKHRPRRRHGRPVSANASGLPKGRPAISAKFDRSRIMKEAHFMARWRVNTVGGSYRAWFAKTLAAEWRKAKERAERREWNSSTY